MWLTDVAIKRPVFTVMVFIALIVMGISSMTMMPVDKMPKIDVPMVTVTTIYPGAGPEEIESLVTKKIEDQVSSVDKIDIIKSVSREGISTVIIQFLIEADGDVSAAEVRAKVAIAKKDLPDDAKEPIVSKLDVDALPVITIGITSDSMNIREVKTLVKNIIADRFAKQNGVGNVDVSGGDTREILILADQERLIAHSMTIAELKNLLQAANLNVPSGNMKPGIQENAIKLLGEFQSINEIKNLRISKTTKNGMEIIRLSDIADVIDGNADREAFTRLNGVDSVGLTIRKQGSANTLKTVEAVKEELESVKKDYPQLTIKISDDQSINIKNSIESVFHELLLGGLLAVLVIFIFLHNFRFVFIVIIALPSPMIATFIILFAAGQTLNMMSLMGLTLCIGILIDDTIVVLENIHRHLKMGKDPRTAAYDGRTEIGLAAIAITMTDCVIYLPVAFMGGIVGKVFFSFGITVASATLFSLFTSYTLTPMLASRWLKSESEENKKSVLEKFFDLFDRFYDGLDSFYRAVLDKALKVRWLVVLAGMGSLVVSLIFVAPHIQVEFAPKDDQGKILVKIELPTTVNVTETDRITKKIEEIICNKKDFPEVRSVFTSVGAEAGSVISSGAQGPEYASVSVDIGQRGDRKRSAYEIGRLMTEKFSPIPYDITVTYPASLGTGDVPVQIEVTGNRFQRDTLLDVAEKVKVITERTSGTTNVTMSWKEGKPETKVIVDRLKLATTPFTVAYIGSILRTSVAGNTDTKYREYGEEYDIRIRLQEKYRKENWQTGNIYIGDIKGKPVYIKNVANLVTKPAPNNIDHRNKQLAVIVKSELAKGAALGNVQAEITRTIAKEITLPAGITVKFGGDTKIMIEAYGFMLQSMVLAIILVYLVMASIFESYINPFIIMFALPQAMVGGFLALFLTGATMSIFTMLGFIMLIGLVGKNAILLIDYTNTLRGRGVERDEALKQAGPTRLRPILMTTAALIFALFPVAMGIGSGAELRQPMSIAVIGGLTLSTLLTLLVIPVLYAQFDDFMVWFNRIRGK